VRIFLAGYFVGSAVLILICTAESLLPLVHSVYQAPDITRANTCGIRSTRAWLTRLTACQPTTSCFPNGAAQFGKGAQRQSSAAPATLPDSRTLWAVQPWRGGQDRQNGQVGPPRARPPPEADFEPRSTQVGVQLRVQDQLLRPDLVLSLPGQEGRGQGTCSRAALPARSPEAEPGPGDSVRDAGHAGGGSHTDRHRLQEAAPNDPSFGRWVSETEAELSIIKGKLHALKTPAARLQACLTKKAGADKEVANAEAAARAATEVLELAKGRLVAATDAQATLETELRDLRLDGLLGPEAAATVQTPSPVNLLKFATAILQAVAPSAIIPPDVLQQMAVMCNLCAPPVQPERVPGGSATPLSEKKVRSRSPSASNTRVQEAPAVRAAKAAYEAAVVAAALEAEELEEEPEGADSVFGAAGGNIAMEVTDTGATAPAASRGPVLVAPRIVRT
jgi:hypothetical protein